MTCIDAVGHAAVISRLTAGGVIGLADDKLDWQSGWQAGEIGRDVLGRQHVGGLRIAIGGEYATKSRQPYAASALSPPGRAGADHASPPCHAPLARRGHRAAASEAAFVLRVEAARARWRCWRESS